MSFCRICLRSKPRQYLTQLKNQNQSGEFVVLFCLGIQIQDSGHTKFCVKCFKKIVEFHKFKSLAIKNEAYWRSIGIQVFVTNNLKKEAILTGSDHEYVDPLMEINKIENCKQEIYEEPLEFEPHHTRQNEQLAEIHVKQEVSDDEPLSKIAKHEFEDIDSTYKKNNKIRETCNECGKSVIHMALHLETHKPNEQRKCIQCAHCNNLFADKTTIKRHIKNFHTERNRGKKLKKKIKCQQCSLSFCSEKEMEEHVKKTHLGIKSQCPVCKKYFNHEYLKSHVQVRHQLESLRFQCETCSRRFLTQPLLRRHMTCHSNDKPFSCELCSARFRLKYSVYLHKRQVHDKDKNHVCHICSTQFVTNSRLQKHLRRHAPIEAGSGDETQFGRRSKNDLLKQVICPDCGKPLATQKTLIEHRKLHTGEKNVKCKVCNLSFATKKYVLRHMKTHTQERKFLCKYCPARFVRSAGRRRHEVELHLQPAGQIVYTPKPNVKRKRASRTKITQNNNNISSEPTGEVSSPNDHRTV